MKRIEKLAPTVFMAGAVMLALGCGPKPAPQVSTVRLVATDYGFEVSGTPTAGPVRVEMVNEGRELHHAQIIRLEDGKTLADLAGLDPEAPPPAWAVPMGGPGAVNPGGTSRSIQTLPAGNYAVTCFIPSPDSMPHLMKGMAASFTVAPAEGEVATAPAADLTIRLVDFAFQGPAEFAAGKKVLKVVNDGPQLHELVLARLDDGKTADDLFAWFTSGMNGAPPASFIGGTVGILPGGENIVEAEFVAGNYLLLCFLPNTAGDMQPHVMHGMVMPLTVTVS